MAEGQSFGRSVRQSQLWCNPKVEESVRERKEGDGAGRAGRFGRGEGGTRQADRLLDFDTDQEGRSDSWRLADQGQACTGITVKNLTISKSLLTPGARLPLEMLVAAEDVAMVKGTFPPPSPNSTMDDSQRPLINPVGLKHLVAGPRGKYILNGTCSCWNLKSLESTIRST